MKYIYPPLFSAGCNAVNIEMKSNQEYQELDADSCLGPNVQFNEKVVVGENRAFDLEIAGNVCLSESMNFAIKGPERYALGLIPGPDCSAQCV